MSVGKRDPTMFKKNSTYWNSLILVFSLASFSFFNGLAGCDSAPSAADTASTSEGAPVDVTPTDPSVNNPPPAEEPPSDGGSEPLPANPQSPVKKVILVIGSGMGPQQTGQLVQYRRLRKPTEAKLALEKLLDKKTMGLVTTHSYLDLVSDTASATSSMACGLKTRNNTVGLNANGLPCENLLEKAFKMGKATGIVSNTKLTQPGVASLLAHHLNSQEENAIASEILAEKTIDVLLVGGAENLIPQFKSQAAPPQALHLAPAKELSVAPSVILNPGIYRIPLKPFLPATPDQPAENLFSMLDLSECEGIDADLNTVSQRTDQTNLIEQAKTNGYQFICKKDQLNGLASSDQTKVLGVFSGSHFPRSPERKGLNTLPSLAEMTGKALEVLDKKPNGFLLVVNDGLTRLAAEENDPGTMLQEELDFDSALAVALDYAEKNADTLLIVTSDHESGGFGFAFSKQPGNDLNLPSGDHYEAPYNYAPAARYDLFLAQQKSFYAMTKELVDQVYAATPTLDLDSAANELVSDVQANTPFKLSLVQAKEILNRAPGADNAQTQDFSSFYVNDNIHSNLMGRAVSAQTSTVWASGTSTSTPVLVLATGPAAYANRVLGMIDNTDIGKIIVAALAGR